MDANQIKDIKALAKILSDAGLNTLEYSDNDIQIRLEKNNTIEMPNNINTEKTIAIKDIVSAPINNQVIQNASNDSTSVDFNRLQEVKSPMIGVFYKAPAEDAEPFVKVGDKVKKGDTLCIIEAMKMMNEITSDFDGEIVDICVNNAQVVEFSQVLFKIC